MKNVESLPSGSIREGARTMNTGAELGSTLEQQKQERDKEIESLQGDPDVYRDPLKSKSLGRERSEIASRLAVLYTLWEELAGNGPSGS